METLPRVGIAPARRRELERKAMELILQLPDDPEEIAFIREYTGRILASWGVRLKENVSEVVPFRTKVS